MRRSDHGTTRALPQAEMERYAEIIAALKIRTSNKNGRHLSTRRAIELLEEDGVETPEGLVRAPKGVLNERRQHGIEVAEMDLDPVGVARVGDIGARQPDMLGVTLDGIDVRLRAAMREPASRVAKRGAELEDTLRRNRCREHAQRASTPSAGPSPKGNTQQRWTRRCASVCARIAAKGSAGCFTPDAG